MRAAIAFAAILLAAAYAATPTAAAEPQLTDAVGDAAIVAAGQPLPSPAPTSGVEFADVADLLSLEIVEAEQALQLVLKVASLSAPQHSAIYEIDFSWDGVPYQVAHYRSRFEAIEQDYAYTMLRRDAGEGFEKAADLVHVEDSAGGVLTVDVPKVYILDGAARMPLRGDKLSDVSVTALGNSMAAVGLDNRAEDRMPDEGGAEFVFTKGGLASGHLDLYSPNPVRVSNGGATTFIFQATLKNGGDAEDTVDIGVSDLPPDWKATVRSPVVVPAGSEKTVTVLTSVPFAHLHGGFDSFALTATSARDAAAVAAVRLGVLHTPIPMPAGHHQEVFLHGQPKDVGPSSKVFTSVPGVMNTMSEHEGDVEFATPSLGTTSPTGGETFTWWIPLAPMMSMGFDFDVTKTASLVASVVGKRVGEGTIEGALWYSGNRDDGVLLAQAPAVPLALDAQSATPFALEFAVTPEADYVPYTRDRNLWLGLVMTRPVSNGVCCPAETSPGLTIRDFKLALPLNEYHDRLTGDGEGLGGVSLAAGGPVERAGAPGSLLTYAFTLKNGGDAEEVFVIDLVGTAADLATVVPDTDVRLGAGESRAVTVAVTIPPEANDGQDFEVLVFAYAKADPARLAIARTITTASVDAAAADESAVLDAARNAEGGGIPGFALLGALAAAGAAALGRPRRR